MDQQSTDTHSNVPGTSRRKWLCRLAVGGLLLLLLWLGGSYLVARRLTGRARPPFPEPTPTVSWGQLEAFRLHTPDGQELGAWFAPGKLDAPAVLLLHGNGGARTDCLAAAEMLTPTGCSLLLLSQRCHGDSSGEHNDFGWSGRHDVLAAVDWLKRRVPGRPIVVWGKSLGSAAALFAAEDLGLSVRAYILECPYRDLRTAMRQRTALHLPPVLDRVAAAGLLAVSPLVLPELDQIAPVEAAAHVPTQTRVLILAGGADRRARVEEALAIRNRLPGEAEVVLFADGDHLRLQDAEPERYRATVLGFVKKAK